MKEKNGRMFEHAAVYTAIISVVASGYLKKLGSSISIIPCGRILPQAYEEV